MRDAGGNIMAVYNIGYGSLNGGAVTLSEQNLYGSSRLGIYKPNTKLSGVLNIDLGTPLTGLNSTGYKIGFERGRKNFELVNHLGNVLVTISDKKIGIDNNSDTLINYYLADVVSASDYYPFGMQMLGRTYTANSASSYRYGYGGHEKTDEIYGSGNAYDMGARMYDPRIGRTPSIDPKANLYPGVSPYAYALNTPIQAKDPDGNLVIFINGLWGSPNGVTEPLEDYWGNWGKRRWIDVAQDAIGDHKTRFYDGSLGGTSRSMPGNRYSNTNVNYRISEGKKAGYNDAKNIIAKLDKDETIKIVTNSMGSAFERGFTQGLFQYQTEENERRSAFNAGIDKQLSPLYEQKNFLEAFKADVPSGNMTAETTAKLATDLNTVNSKIGALEAQKQGMLDIKIEMVVDLSSHQIDYADPNAQSSYYMTTGKENMNIWERGFVDQKAVKGATNLGTMSSHHSSGANPDNLPSAQKRDQ